jgi:hypothetical protein
MLSVLTVSSLVLVLLRLTSLLSLRTHTRAQVKHCKLPTAALDEPSQRALAESRQALGHALRTDDDSSSASSQVLAAFDAYIPLLLTWFDLTKAAAEVETTTTTFAWSSSIATTPHSYSLFTSSRGETAAALVAYAVALYRGAAAAQTAFHAQHTSLQTEAAAATAAASASRLLRTACGVLDYVLAPTSNNNNGVGNGDVAARDGGDDAASPASALLSPLDSTRCGDTHAPFVTALRHACVGGAAELMISQAVRTSKSPSLLAKLCAGAMQTYQTAAAALANVAAATSVDHNFKAFLSTKTTYCT